MYLFKVMKIRNFMLHELINICLVELTLLLHFIISISVFMCDNENILRIVR